MAGQRITVAFPALMVLGLAGAWAATVVPMALGLSTDEFYPMSAYPMFSTEAASTHRHYVAVAEGPDGATGEVEGQDLFDGRHELDVAETLRLFNAAFASAKAGCDDFRLRGFAACAGNATDSWSAPPDLAGLWLDSATQRLGWRPTRLVLVAETTDLSLPPDDPARTTLDRFGVAEAERAE